ncbi:MAG: DUF6515 family protein [Candidatus Omnitrophica bacterium]|nr:DUF6515 family protein [Candidatus Omnitrophota bacterium]
MKRTIRVNKSLPVTIFSIVVIMSCANAFAADRGWDNNRGKGYDRGRESGPDKKFSGSRQHEVVVVGHERYNYHDGRFYRPSWFGFEFLLSTPPFGAIVMSLPIGHHTVVIGGAQYYSYNNVYYKPCPSGYAVVPQPAVAVAPAPVFLAPQQVPNETVTINVPNSNGSYTAITLVKRDNGYIGPQGEYYPDHPTLEQLRALYGR